MADFWSIIGKSSTHGAGDVKSALDRISGQLDGLEPDELVRFVEKLHELLYKIDRRDLAEVPVRLAGGLELPQTSDHFLYARCACILAVEEAYGLAAKSAAEFEPYVKPSVQAAEGLLHVAADVYRKQMGTEMEVANGFPVDSMSNAQGWAS